MNDNLENINGTEEVTTEPAIIGMVFNCIKLNVRKKPTKAGDVLCIIEAGTEVIIDTEKSTNTWYYVTTPSGIEGYCMKQFIEVK